MPPLVDAEDDRDSGMQNGRLLGGLCGVQVRGVGWRRGGWVVGEGEGAVGLRYGGGRGRGTPAEGGRGSQTEGS